MRAVHLQFGFRGVQPGVPRRKRVKGNAAPGVSGNETASICRGKCRRGREALYGRLDEFLDCC